MKKFFKGTSVIMAVLSCFIFTLSGYFSYITPSSYTINSAENDEFRLQFPVSATLNSDSLTSVSTSNQSDKKSGSAEIMLFNSIPIKQVDINVQEKKYVIPCGTPFGVKIFTQGVVVIKTEDIELGNGKTVNPAKEAGINEGDVILSVNGESVNTNEEMSDKIKNSNGNELKIKVRRKNIIFVTTLNPVAVSDNTPYRAGIWVRDSSAGIGTMTFYDAESGCFAGLGHGICDTDTGELMPLQSGDIVDANINGIVKGEQGKAGSLRGYFLGSESIGHIFTNCDEGVYGKSYNIFSDNEAMPIAQKQEVTTGKAQILTTIDGTEPKYYDIEIEQISYNNGNTKNMIIKVTDEELLEKAGGIVQGMSGSPIIQNGMLVGAVTHVFVNDPTRGYAIFVENMYDILENVAQNSLDKSA